MKKLLSAIGIIFGIAIFAQLIGVSFAAAYPPALGGTGTTQIPASGTVLIGNGAGTYSPALLTAGTNIVITNASGSVTLAVNGSNFLPSSTVYVSSVNSQSGAVTITSSTLGVATNTLSLYNGNGFTTTTIQSVLNKLSATGLLTYNSSTGAFGYTSSSLNLKSASQYNFSDFLPSSTVYVATVNGQSGAVTVAVPATTTINGVQSASFRLIGDGSTVTTTLSGSTTTFSIINTGNWAGTWQGVNSTTFYLASNPQGFTSSTVFFVTGANGVTTTISGGTTTVSVIPGFYLTPASGTALYYPLTSNPAGYVTSTSGGVATGTVLSVGSPFTIGGVATGTLYGSFNDSFLAQFNSKYLLPTPSMLSLGTSCGGVYPVYDAYQCLYDIYQNAPSSTQIDIPGYYYSVSYPGNFSILNKYVFLNGVPGATEFQWNESGGSVASASSTTNLVTYTSLVGTIANGYPITFTGSSLPAGVSIKKHYYIGNLNTGADTFEVYSDPELTSPVTITGTGTGTFDVVSLNFDISDNKAKGWGFDGLTLIGPNAYTGVGYFAGGVQGATDFIAENSLISKFYINQYWGDNNYFALDWDVDSEFNATNNVGGGLFYAESSGNSGEDEVVGGDSNFHDGNPAAGAIEIQQSGEDDYEFNQFAWDDAQFLINQYCGQGNNVDISQSHEENPGWAGIPVYTPIEMNTGNPCLNDVIKLNQVTFQNDATGAKIPAYAIDLYGQLTASQVSGDDNGGGPIPDLVNLGETSDTIQSTGYTYGNNGNGPGFTYLYNSIPIQGGTQTYGVTTTFANLPSLNCLGTNANGDVIAGTCSGSGGGVATTTPYSANYLPVVSSTGALTNSNIEQFPATAGVPATSTITFDASSTLSFTAGSSTVTSTITIGIGQNEALWIGLNDTNTATATAITVNGKSATFVNRELSSSHDTEGWEATGTAPGVANVVATFSTSTATLVENLSSYFGVNQFTPVTTSTATNIATTTITTSVAGEVIIDNNLANQANSSAYNASSVVLTLGLHNAPYYSSAMYLIATSSGSNAIGWNTSATNIYEVAAAFQPATTTATAAASSSIVVSNHFGFATSSVSVTNGTVIGGDHGGKITVTTASTTFALTFANPWNYTSTICGAWIASGTPVVFGCNATTTLATFTTVSPLPTTTIFQYIVQGNPN